MSALTFLLQVLGYDDVPPTSNPTVRTIDYSLTQASIPVDNAEMRSFQVDPGASLLVFNGVRSTSVDNTTAFDLTISPVSPTTYRLAWSGTGTAPAFRTSRGVNCSNIQLTLQVLANLTLQVTAGSGTPFTGVQDGDQVFIPGIKTGDPTGPFNDLNCGLWTVLAAVSSTVIILGRLPGMVWEGFSEIVTPSTAAQFQIFTSAGVQVGDTVDLSAGFASPTLRAFDVTAVTSSWVEFTSTSPLGIETGVVPSIAGFAIYTYRKRFIGIRTDQEIVVQYNGDSGTYNRIEPLIAGTFGMEGSEHKWGSVWSLTIVNRSTVRANVRVASAE